MKHIKKYNEYKEKELDFPIINISIIEDYLLRIKDRGFNINFKYFNLDSGDDMLEIDISFNKNKIFAREYWPIDKIVEVKSYLDFIVEELKTFDVEFRNSIYKNIIKNILYDFSNKIIIRIEFENVKFIQTDK